MCLYKQGEFRVNKNYGYKWFDKNDWNNGKLGTPAKYFDIERRGKWIKNNRQEEINYESNPDSYVSGFHIFYTKEEAMVSGWNRYRRALYKVYFRNYITGYGDGVYGNSYKQIVAQEIKVAERIYPKKKKRKV